MTYPEVLANARECIGKYCKACPVCNGVACKTRSPAPVPRVWAIRPSAIIISGRRSG